MTKMEKFDMWMNLLKGICGLTAFACAIATNRLAKKES